MHEASVGELDSSAAEFFEFAAGQRMAAQSGFGQSGTLMFDVIPSPRSANEFVDKVRAMAPLMKEHRAALERERRLSQPLVAALADADLLRLWVPKSLGGPELSPLDFLDVVEAASELDGSVGWIVGNGAGMSRVAGYLPADVARAWFDEPGAFVASATGATGKAVPVPGGYRVTGRWPFGSGIHHATRVMGLCAVDPDDGKASNSICCYFDPSDLTVIDNWYVSGLRGTGSCDFEAKEVFVPDTHVHDFPNPKPTQPGLLYRIPQLSIFPLSISAVPLGIARSAISTLVCLASTRVRQGSSVALCERETIQAAVGRCEADYRAARAFLVDSLKELMAAIDIGGDRLFSARVAFRLACSHCAAKSEHIVTTMAAGAGSAAILESFDLERQVRDVQAAVKHIAMSPNFFITAGRVRLGIDPGTTKI
jgi:alkylation response protein AidB-like acyl-CoA dehydrogenase